MSIVQNNHGVTEVDASYSSDTNRKNTKTISQVCLDMLDRQFDWHSWFKTCGRMRVVSPAAEHINARSNPLPRQVIAKWVEAMFSDVHTEYYVPCTAYNIPHTTHWVILHTTT